MKKKIIFVSIISLQGWILASCQSTAAPDKSDVHPSLSVVDRVDPADRAAKAPGQTDPLAPAGYLPGTDHLYFVGDSLVARAETSPQPVFLTRSARRLVVGEPNAGDLSYQPALLEKELGEELARSREINAHSHAAMEKMMAATSRLVDATQELAQRNKQLAERLEQQIAYTQSLQAGQSHPEEEP